MTPTGDAVLLLLAVAVDYVSIGPNWLRDRLAFLMAIAAIYEGFNGSQLDAWTLARLTDLIQFGLDQARDSGAYIGAALAAPIVGVLVGCIWLYGLGALLPQRASKRLGRFASVNFPPSGIWALNYKLWAVAALLGLLGDVPLGWVGSLTEGTNQFLAALFAPLPGILLGGH
jgi:hypothetical protein